MVTGKKIALSMAVAVILFAALNVLAFSHLALPESISLYPLSVKMVVFLCVFISVFLLLFLAVNLRAVEENRPSFFTEEESPKNAKKSAKKEGAKKEAGGAALGASGTIPGSGGLTFSTADVTLMEEVKRSHQGQVIDRMLDSVFQDAGGMVGPFPGHPEPLNGESANYFFPVQENLFSFNPVPLPYLENRDPGVTRAEKDRRLEEFKSLVADVLS